MNLRKKDLLPGQEAWACDVTKLPDGLRDGALLQVLGRVPCCHSWAVREVGTGRVFELGHVDIDNGYEWEISPGQWIPEHHAEVLDYLEAEFAATLAEYAADEQGRHHERQRITAGNVAFLARVLKRNGREIPCGWWNG